MAQSVLILALVVAVLFGITMFLLVCMLNRDNAILTEDRFRLAGDLYEERRKVTAYFVMCINVLKSLDEGVLRHSEIRDYMKGKMREMDEKGAE